MAKQKEPMEFLTAREELERALARIQEELAKNKADWKSMGVGVLSAATEMKKLVELRKISGKVYDTNLIILESLFLAGLISKLGIELTETHVRLAKVEEAIKELRLGK
jgi:hypothetical protein